MLPVLLKFGNVTIRSYGVMIFIAFLVGVWQFRVRTRKLGVTPQEVRNFALIALVMMVVSSRLFYVAFHWSEFRHNIIGIFAFWRGGLSGLMFYGGYITGFLATLIYSWAKKMPKLKIQDAIAPSIVLGEGITRIGCFLNGCCFGKPTDLPIGVVFPAGSAAGSVFPGQPIHPTQLYASFGGFFLFFLATRLEKLHLKEGVVFAILLTLCSLFRFCVDFLRYYEDAANYRGNQIASLAMTLVGVVCLVVFSLRKRAPVTHATGRD